MKHILPRLLMALCALTISVSSLWADRVSQEDAALVAANFFNAPDTTQGDTTAAQSPKRNRPMRRVALAAEAQYYVYANADGEGWVMVAANDVARPIIAYSDEGEFRTDNQPANIKSWLGKYNRQIKQAEADGVQATDEVKQAWKQLRKGAGVRKGTPVVAALIKTKWDQDAPYYNQCPQIDGTHCLTGCVATAMAQVMNYWQWPETGTGSASVTVNNTKYTVDFTTGNYDWNNMLQKYKGYYPEGSSNWTTSGVSSGTTDQKNAVAKLMYHCGVAAEMDYGTDVSGAYTIYPNKSYTTTRCAQYALINNFGYNSSTIKGYYRKGGYGYTAVSDANWHSYLKTELDAARPIMYAGADNEGGHSFICDGYDNTTPTRKYHFNWGWSGYCDGYYDVDALVPGTGGSGSGNGSYNDSQDIIIGIMPPETGHRVVLSGTGCTLAADSRVKNGNSLTVTITPTDATYDYTSTTVKLGSTTVSSSNYTLSPDKKTLTIKAAAITGDESNDLTITVVWTKNRYKYEMLGEDCSMPDDGVVAMNASLSLTITPASGYTLADAACWEVTMGGNTLMYGTGFTYSGTTFSIAKVTGDVEIYAFGGRQVSWYADGSLHTTNMSISDKITLPTDPADCSGSNGKKFVGWCTISDYSHATTAPTFAKDNDAYSVATYYAVYATDASGSAPRRATMASGDYELVEAAPSDWSGDYLIAYSSEVFADGRKGGTSGIGAQNSSVNPGANLSGKIVAASWGDTYKVTIEASSTSGKYLLKTQDGAYNYQTSNANGCASTTTKATAESYPLSIAFNSSSDIAITVSSTAFHYNTQGYFRFYKNAGQSAIYLYKKVSSSGGSGGGGSYTDYSTACGTPCSQTPTMSFSQATVDKTTADANFTQAVTISGKGSGQTVAYSSSDETIATVNASGVVTLKGKVGSTTITASVAANGDYCSASASYTLNVTAAPISVTLYYNNSTATLNNQTPPYTLPTGSPYNAAMCNGDWTFVGWCASTYAKSTNEPTYITQLDATGSAYAVYTTTETVSSAPARAQAETSQATYTFTTKSWAATEGNWTSGQDGAGYNNSGVQVTAKATGANATCPSSYDNISSIVVSYCTNSSSGAGNIVMSVGSTELSQSVSTSGGTSARDMAFDFSSSTPSGTPKITVNCTTNSIYVCGVTINYGSSGGGTTTTTYYATTPECVTPCSNTPEMSFTNSTVNKTTADASYTQTVNITGKGSGQTVAYSSSDVTVATVNNSGVVTLLGKVGSTTITASVEANGDYCAASVSYTINVTVAPIDVTLYYNSTSATINNQTPPYTLPTTSPYNTAMCDDDWTFAGWYGSEYTKSTTAPTYITQLSATGSAYAVYTTTETVSSAPARAKADDSGTKTFKFSDIASANSWANSEAYTTVTDAPVTITAEGGGNNGKWYTSGDGSWRMYSGGTVRITVEGGAVTSVTSSPTCEFTISDGEATFSPSARTDFTEIVVNYTFSGGGSSTTKTYYATTPECVTPCSKTPTMSFTEETVTKTTADAGFTQAVSISNYGSGQTVAYSSSNETVAMVSNLGAVTLKGVVGSTTITASVAADGDYCAASASYTLNVTAVTHTVTWVACGDVYKTDTFNEGAALVLPDTPGANAGKAFVGWTAMEHYTGASAPPDMFTTAGSMTVTVNVTYYAVYE